MKKMLKKQLDLLVVTRDDDLNQHSLVILEVLFAK